MNMNIVVPLAGMGSRFLAESDKNPEYKKPKPIINIAGHAMVKWALSSYPLTGEENLIFIVRKEHVEEAQIDQKLKEIFGNNIRIIVQDSPPAGAACTVLLAKDLINNDLPLLITDSDHYIDGATHFKSMEDYEKIDGLIPVFYANNPKWSFAKTDEEGIVTETAEKFRYHEMQILEHIILQEDVILYGLQRK
jgi:NDP-sugar pyrophosphorylase family protein